MTFKTFVFPILGTIALAISAQNAHAKEKHPYKNLAELVTQESPVVLSLVNPNMLAYGQQNTFVHFNLVELDMAKNKFKKKNKPRVGHEFSNRKKFSYKYDEDFKKQYLIGHIPEGHYAVVSMETNRYLKFGKGRTQTVKCNTNFAPVYHFNAGQFYYLKDANTARLKPANDSLDTISQFVSAEINAPVQFDAAVPIGYIAFKGSEKNIIGNRIKCPEGKKFTYTEGGAAELK